MRKRLFDIAGAVAGVIVFAPVAAVVAAAILLEDGRPVLFAQFRLGRSEISDFRFMIVLQIGGAVRIDLQS